MRYIQLKHAGFKRQGRLHWPDLAGESLFSLFIAIGAFIASTAAAYAESEIIATVDNNPQLAMVDHIHHNPLINQRRTSKPVPTKLSIMLDLHLSSEKAINITADSTLEAIKKAIHKQADIAQYVRPISDGSPLLFHQLYEQAGMAIDNGRLAYEEMDPVRFYVGGQIGNGPLKNKSKALKSSSRTSLAKQHSKTFRLDGNYPGTGDEIAYQILSSLEYPLNYNWRLYAEYKFYMFKNNNVSQHAGSVGFIRDF